MRKDFGYTFTLIADLQNVFVEELVCDDMAKRCQSLNPGRSSDKWFKIAKRRCWIFDF